MYHPPSIIIPPLPQNPIMKISITEKAANAVRESICDAFRLRVSANKGGCSGWRWELETESLECQNQENDLVFESNSIEIIVDRDLLYNIIGETIIDYTSANIVEQGFVFMRSNGQQCGCGESFTPVSS